MITMAESESAFRITTDTPYNSLMGYLCGVYCEDLAESWTCYDSTELYNKTVHEVYHYNCLLSVIIQGS